MPELPLRVGPSSGYHQSSSRCNSSKRNNMAAVSSSPMSGRHDVFPRPSSTVELGGSSETTTTSSAGPVLQNGDENCLRGETGVSNHVDNSRRQSDQEVANHERLRSLMTTACPAEEKKEEAGIVHRKNAFGSTSSGSSSDSIPVICIHTVPSLDRKDDESESSSQDENEIEEEEDEEEEEKDQFPMVGNVVPRRSSRDGAYKFHRKDTGSRDHEVKGRRRLDEARRVRLRLEEKTKGSEIMEEEEA